jgi:uncharacterized protein (TIGR02594 family)
MSGQLQAFKDAPWYPFALGELGVKEIEGTGSNPRIEQYHAETSIGKSDDSVPWCSSFACFCVERAHIASPKNPAARSWLKWGRAIEEPVKGCIVVLKRGTQAWQGHVGFYAGEELTEAGGEPTGYILLLSGNSRNMVRIGRYKKADILGYRMPKRYRDSTTIASAGTGAAAVSAGAGYLMPILSKILEHPATLPVLFGIVLVAVLVSGYVIKERARKIDERQI